MGEVLDLSSAKLTFTRVGGIEVFEEGPDSVPSTEHYKLDNHFIDVI